MVPALQRFGSSRAQCARSGSPSENTDTDHRIVVIGVLTPLTSKGPRNTLASRTSAGWERRTGLELSQPS